MVKCSVMNCSGGSDRSVSLFKIPKETGLREKWLNFLVQSGREIRYDVEYKVCEQHFLPSDIIMCETKKILRSGFVPTVFPKVSQHKLFSIYEVKYLTIQLLLQEEIQYFEAEFLEDDELQSTDTYEETFKGRIMQLEDTILQYSKGHL
jgi:hypothetical protein